MRLTFKTGSISGLTLIAALPLAGLACKSNADPETLNAAPNTAAKRKLASGDLVRLPDTFTFPVVFNPVQIESQLIADANGDPAAVKTALDAGGSLGHIVSNEKTVADPTELISLLEAAGDPTQLGTCDLAQSPAVGCIVSSDGEVRFTVLPNAQAGRRVWTERTPDDSDPAAFERYQLVRDPGGQVSPATTGKLLGFMPSTHEEITLTREHDQASADLSALYCRLETDGSFSFFVGLQ